MLTKHCSQNARQDCVARGCCACSPENLKSGSDGHALEPTSYLHRQRACSRCLHRSRCRPAPRRCGPALPCACAAKLVTAIYEAGSVNAAQFLRKPTMVHDHSRGLCCLPLAQKNQPKWQAQLPESTVSFLTMSPVSVGHAHLAAAASLKHPTRHACSGTRAGLHVEPVLIDAAAHRRGASHREALGFLLQVESTPVCSSL